MYAYARNNPLVYTDPLGLSYEICGNNGGDCGVYSDEQYAKILKDKSNIFANGTIYGRNKNGTQGDVLGTVKDQGRDLEDRGQQVIGGLATRANASNQFIAAFAAASVVAGTGVGIGLQATSSGLTTLESAAPYFRYTPGQLNQLIGGAQKELLKDLFGQGQQGALSRLSNLRLPEGLTRETLEIYKEAAVRVLQRGPGAPGFEVQQLRLQIVEKAISILK